MYGGEPLLRPTWGVLEFVDALAQRMAAIKVGPGIAPDTGCGALINRAAVEKIEALLGDAVGRGARVVIGGSGSCGSRMFLPANRSRGRARGRGDSQTGDLRPGRRDRAVRDGRGSHRAANDTEYGLVAYVYTADLKTGLRIAEALESGMVAINRGLVSDPAAPFGGVKQSGLGREGSHHGLREFTEAKYIAVDW